MYVMGGDISISSVASPSRQIRRAEALVLHFDYDESKLQNDLAYIRVGEFISTGLRSGYKFDFNTFSWKSRLISQQILRPQFYPLNRQQLDKSVRWLDGDTQKT